MHLKARKQLEATIDDAANESHKAKTLIFIREHMKEALQM